MEAAKAYFEQIVEKFSALEGVAPGPMMSAPGIRLHGKVFAFYSKPDEMVFKLGKNFDPTSFVGVPLTPFNPFKNKGPLAGWFAASYADKEAWEGLTERALGLMHG